MESWNNNGEELVGNRRKPNILQIWGNSTTMNLNTLILTNITNSPYFKGQLAELTTYHEIVDEIYYKVAHLEPWEKGSRRTAGQTGMCGGVRGVGAGGIISSAFCLLYKLYTLKLTRKQVNSLINHRDSPYIRGLGFMYIRFTQHPDSLWEWFEPFLDDTEELDVRAGGGQIMTIGLMLRQFLIKLDWFSSLFPRIPVPIQMIINEKLGQLKEPESERRRESSEEREREREKDKEREKERKRRERTRSRSRSPSRTHKKKSHRRSRSRSRSRSPKRHKDSSSSHRHSSSSSSSRHHHSHHRR